MLSLFLLGALPRWALDSRLPPVPPKATYSALPADAIPLNVTFGDTVMLHGWRYAPYTRWWPFANAGWANSETYPAYTVELFWSITAETDAEYQFFIGIVGDDDVRYGSLDRALGTVSYPPHTTNNWTPNIIYSELISFQPNAEMPRRVSLPVRVGVYTREGTIFTQGDKTTPLLITDPPTLTGVVLQTVALYTGEPTPLPVPETALRFASQIGTLDVIALDMPTAAPGTTAAWTLTWQAASDLRGDAILFIHIMDADNALAAQHSAAPLPTLATSNWPPHLPLTSSIEMPMPAEPGTYSVYLGLIDAQTGERWPIDAPDNRPLVGTLTVR